MEYRKEIQTSEELGRWYDDKYTEMGDGWNTPAEECNKHLNDLGVPVDHSKWLLDVGAGAGHFLAEAQKRVNVDGFEISKVGIECAAKRGVRLTHRSIEEQPPKHLGHEAAKYDYIVSMGSLEHVVELDQALDNIRHYLKDDGKFYFLCPNENWKHFDQPNERNMTDSEWMELFAKHGLHTHYKKRWNDSTAFIGGKEFKITATKSPNGNKLNIGSGQRRFDNGHGWINVDVVSRPGQVPDLLCDVGRDPLPYSDDSFDLAVLHQVYEHFGCGEGHILIKEIYRVLKPGGSLIITVPDMRALAERWLTREIDDYIYFVNVYGAYQGEAGDRHKWGYNRASLVKDLTATKWAQIKPFDWRPIAGADIARDWWVLGMEIIK